MDTDLVSSAPGEVRLRSVLHAIGVIGGAFLVGIVLAVAGISLLAAVGYTDETAPVVVSVVGGVLQFAGFILAAIGYVYLADERDLIDVSVPSLRDIAWMVGGFVGVFVAAYAVSILVTILGLESAQNVAIETGRENPEYFLYMIPVTILLVGPGEELIFRGLVQGHLKRAFGVVPAIVLASLLFGAVHVVALTGSGRAVYMAVAASLGLVLGIIYERSGNVVVPAVVHGCWNAMLFFVNWYVVVNDVQLPA